MCPPSVGGARARCPFICKHPTQSNRTQPVGTYVRASAPNHVSCSGRAFSRPRTKPSSVVVDNRCLIITCGHRDGDPLHEHPNHIPCSGRALCRPRKQRTICNACNNPPLTVGTLVRASATNEHPNRVRSLSYVDKHNILSIHRLLFASGRTNVRPYWLSAI